MPDALVPGLLRFRIGVKFARCTPTVFIVSFCEVQVLGLLLATVYFLWLALLIFRSFTHIEAMNPEYIFVMVITLITIVGAMSAVYTGALAPDQVRNT